MMSEENLPKEYYQLVVTRKMYISKHKCIEVSSTFSWLDKDKALQVKELLAQANKRPLAMSSRLEHEQSVKFRIVHPDEVL